MSDEKDEEGEGREKERHNEVIFFREGTFTWRARPRSELICTLFIIEHTGMKHAGMMITGMMIAGMMVTG